MWIDSGASRCHMRKRARPRSRRIGWRGVAAIGIHKSMERWQIVSDDVSFTRLRHS